MNIGASGGGSGKYWCAFGVAQQQWGLGNPSINFPIAFPKECFIAAITRAAGNYEHSIVITTKNKTNLSWICKGYDNSAGNTYANWLALGCQLQWGYQKQLTVEPVVYPLPVNTVCCVWAHSIHDRQDPGTYHSILSKITPVGVQILAGQYNAPATAYSGISAYWGMIGC